MKRATNPSPSFSPIAIVGRSCILPGAHSPAQLGEFVFSGRSVVSEADDARWRLSAHHALCDSPANSEDRTWSRSGGYVRGFDEIFDPSGFAVDAGLVARLDPLFQWSLHAAREALRDANVLEEGKGGDVGVILGNLSFPAAEMSRFAEASWLRAAGLDEETLASIGLDDVDPHNRFSSGLPALMIQRALALKGCAFALDAACASSLYAIKLACDELQEGRADTMLAGAVNCADDLFIHVGFCALQALSKTGQSRPFHEGADGLVPAEGAGFVVLKRLADAVRDKDVIHGVIRGVGLSNDGRCRGLLAPSKEGQVRAMKQAYERAGLTPQDISLLECHATGTVVGDAIELESIVEVFGDCDELPIASLKSNTGHLITAAGIAGLIKVTESMRAGLRPPSLHVDATNSIVGDGALRLLTKTEAWEVEGVRRAGISAFGFGGNNAHLIVEEYDPSIPLESAATRALLGSVAIVGLGAKVAQHPNRQAFADALFSKGSSLADWKPGQKAGQTEEIAIPLMGLKFPPNDLQQTLAQQLLILEAAREANESFQAGDSVRTSVLIGMGVDPEVARYGLRWRLAEWAEQWGEGDEWLGKARAGVVERLESAGVLGTMPNIPANRLNSQFDFGGPSFTISAEQHTGLVAFGLGVRALLRDEVDVVMVGAVDMSCESAHQEAVRALLPAGQQIPGDAAIVLGLKRLEDAERDGDAIYALCQDADLAHLVPLSTTEATLSLGLTEGAESLADRFGHAHAASGLVHIAAAALSLRQRCFPDGQPWLASTPRRALVESIAMGGQHKRIALSGPPAASLPDLPTQEWLVYAGQSKADILQQLRAGQTSSDASDGPARLVVVAASVEEREARTRRAILHLEKGAPAGEGVHFCATPVKGEMAFVFTGAGAAYQGMGKELLGTYPALGMTLAESFPSLAKTMTWALQGDTETIESPVMQKLWGACVLCQLHAGVTQGMLGLTPDAWIGYSSGESNSLVASGVWRDMQQMCDESFASGLFERELGGEFRVLHDAWGPSWATWTVLAPVAKVKELVAAEPNVRLPIIHTHRDCVIAGEEAACLRVVEAIGKQHCHRLDYDLVVHVPELDAAKEAWLALHRREATPLAQGRIYTNATNDSYVPTSENCARAIYGQANKTLDFPRTIEKAWADGVRIFVEHGPQGACRRWIKEILGEREHLVVSLDAKGKGNRQLFDAVGALLAAGVKVNLEALATPPTQTKSAVGVRIFPAHPAPIALPLRTRPATGLQSHVTRQPTLTQEERPTMSSQRASTSSPSTSTSNGQQALTPSGNGQEERMAPAPQLSPVMGQSIPDMVLNAAPEAVSTSTVMSTPQVGTSQPGASMSMAPQAHAGSHFTMPQAAASGPMEQILEGWGAYHTQLSSIHQDFVAQQTQLHQQFLQVRQNALFGLQAASQAGALPQVAQPQLPASPRSGASLATSPAHRVMAPQRSQPMPTSPVTSPVRGATTQQAKPAPQVRNGTHKSPVASQAPPPVATPSAVRAPASTAPSPAAPAARVVMPQGTPQKEAPSGLTLSREQLAVHASGNISEIFGPMFGQQDGYARQVRMPEPPLLLADRMTGVKAEPGVLGKGVLWTETDVKADSWYLNDGYMPAGIMIESGQADLMLISYMGIDFLNQGDRVYRLLGCELTYHNRLPSPGETLAYDIHVDGHAKHGDIRLFFFHYDCCVGDEQRLSVREGQAGFFTDEELADSAGILWTPEEQEITKTPRLDPPKALTPHTAFSKEQVEAVAAGRPWACFGPVCVMAQTHTRTPHIQDGKMLFLEEVTEFSRDGGPWGRGYLKAESTIHADDWFFDGHFKNDPCMPGTLMFEGCLQAMAFFMIGLGHSLENDGWRFQPVPENAIAMRCRGQVTPTSKLLTYEVFVEEVHDGPVPRLYADLLCTIDGHKAFHARHTGLELVPDWPMTSMPRLLEGQVASGPVAIAEGFPFDYKSLVSCAWGRPSEAFGPMYEPFDGHVKVPRLPGPPYHFMSRVSDIQGNIGKMEVGTEIEVVYDIPEDAWYFDENGCETMPYAVLLEAALQPCGWLASFVGSARTTDIELSFRNLDGTGTLHQELYRSAGSLRTRTKINQISQSGGMIIEGFEVHCFLGDTLVYTMNTVFGFFPVEAMRNQIGLTTSPAQREVLQDPCDFFVDLVARPARYCDGPLRLPQPMLLMLDRVTGYWPEGGEKGLGRLRSEKDVDPNEWFFKAHFFQDPVQPGSLGIEAMLQLLQFYMLEENMHEGIETPRFEPVAIEEAMTWKYRGQVIPTNKCIQATMDILETGRDAKGPYALAKASLWVDNKRIYEASPVGMRIVSSPTPPRGSLPKKGTECLDPEVDVWLKDHCPTWSRPALPMMSIVERLAAAAPSPVSGLRNVKIKRWFDFDGPRDLRTTVKPVNATDWEVSLFASRGADEEEIATGTVVTGPMGAPPAALAPMAGQKIDAPYESGMLFHGPAFQLVESLVLGENGASSVLDASRHDVPVGLLHQALLDAATHGIPHDNLALWTSEVPADQVAYPALVTAFDVYGPTPTEGQVRCEVRFDGFFGSANFPAFKIQLIHNEQVWVQCRLVEACFPKGPIGSAAPLERRAFLRDKSYVEGLRLSRVDGEETRLSEAEVWASDWLPGTIESIYGTRDVEEVAIREHVAADLQIHPSRVRDGLPLTRFDVSAEHVDGEAGKEVVVRSQSPAQLDITSIKNYWTNWFNRDPWPVEDLYYGLIQRFVGKVVLDDPVAFNKVKGRPILYLANHQVGIESLLFSIVASGLVGAPTVTLAKIEHKTTWLGKLIALCFQYPGVTDPEVITFFDRTDKASLPKIIGQLAVDMATLNKSVMVHIEGTRSLDCCTPVKKMSGIFIDMALEVGVPIVPVRLIGALPTQTMDERIEFPAGMSKQDIWLGRPILPEELGQMTYLERKNLVIDSINNLGVPNSEESLLSCDAAFAQKVDAHHQQSGAAYEDAVLLEILRELPERCEQSQRILDAFETGSLPLADTPEEAWLGELAGKLFGPRGPKCVG